MKSLRKTLKVEDPKPPSYEPTHTATMANHTKPNQLRVPRPVLATPSPFTVTITDDERKQMRQDIQGKPLVVSVRETMKLLRNLFKNWGTTDIAFTCIHDVLAMSVFNQEEMNKQMLLWKDLAKSGKLEVLEENNYSHTIDGKEYYFLTISPIGHITMISPIGTATGFLVNGYIYGFRRKSNRDAVFHYIKKFCRNEDHSEQKDNE